MQSTSWNPKGQLVYMFWTLKLRSAAILLLVAAIISFAAEETLATRPPNIVLIISDDQAWTDFGFMGHPVIETPRIDRLAAESTVFRHGYVPTALCRASLATLLTGLYPHQHMICTNDPPDGQPREVMLPFIERCATVPELLASAGYTSMQTGKYWEKHYRTAGFTHGMTTKGRHGEDGLAIGRKTMQPLYDFIEKHRAEPFFIWYAPMLPHTPHDPPPKLLAKYSTDDRPDKLARYYANCERFDTTCGQLLDYIDELGLRDNTLVAFVVDNGWIQETGSQRTTRGWFAPKSKLSPYDGGLRTPIMLRWSGRTEQAVYDDLVSSIDVAPTLLAAAGVDVPHEMPGMNLLPRCAGGQPIERDAVYGANYVHSSVDVNNPAANLTHRWIRHGRWKLIVPVDEQDPFELYDVHQDPHEEHNVAEDNADIVADLRAQLDAWWTP